MNTCMIGVASSDTIPVVAAESIHAIRRQPGDGVPIFAMATKGYEGRQRLVDGFMASDHDMLLLLDHDMIFDPDTLERLRAHDVPFVSGYYLRRSHTPIAPVWTRPWDGEWPFMPWLEDPERGKLHAIGSSGWGCILLHREVIEGTRRILCGEQDVIEDDMDVWPYDLAAVMRGEQQLRPLRGDKRTIIGSDIRYPFYALHAGYQLYGDPDVRPRHILDYPLSPDDYAGVPSGVADNLRRNTLQKRAEETAQLKELMGQW